jgi:N-acetylglucosaminyldiphosphoundecaprenol N-acetyl-beta-D-mannosaminyltransferase
MTHTHSDPALPLEDALPLMASEGGDARVSFALQQPLEGSPYAVFLESKGSAQRNAQRNIDEVEQPDRVTAARLNSYKQQSSKQQSSKQQSAKVDILGMDFDNFSKQELLANLSKGVVFTPNVDHLMKLRRDPEFVSVYQKADFKVCDSQILMYASRFLGKPLKAKLSGADLFPWFCEHHKHNESIKVFLLGGAEGIAQEAQRRINERTGREIVVGEYSPPFGFEKDTDECAKIVSLIENSPANVLVVCLGAPKQEKWIATYRDQLPNIDIFMAVGAAVDFEAGCKPRAPHYVSELGLEWLYRLVCEPRRLWHRYLVEGMPFVGLVLAEKLKQMRLPKAQKSLKNLEKA